MNYENLLSTENLNSLTVENLTAAVVELEASCESYMTYLGDVYTSDIATLQQLLAIAGVHRETALFSEEFFKEKIQGNKYYDVLMAKYKELTTNEETRSNVANIEGCCVRPNNYTEEVKAQYLTKSNLMKLIFMAQEDIDFELGIIDDQIELDISNQGWLNQLAGITDEEFEQVTSCKGYEELVTKLLEENKIDKTLHDAIVTSNLALVKKFTAFVKLEMLVNIVLILQEVIERDGEL